MVYSSRPLKRARTGKYSKSRSKSRQSRKFSSAGPSRTLVPRQSLPEIKRLDSDIGVTTAGFSQHVCFNTMRGTSNSNRIGNTINMKGIKIKFDLTENEPGGSNNYSVYLVRDTEPHTQAPQSHTDWEFALFADPIHTISWRTNFRNPDYTERFQIVRKWDASKSDYANGLLPLHGYLQHNINGTTAKYGTGQAGMSLPTNVNYYVLYWCGNQAAAAHTPLIRIREEFTDN